MIDKINGAAFKEMVLFGAACIAGQKQAINDLNVFPVPDGDTGTNMYLTIQTACAELKKAEPATIDDAAKVTARGLLRGARGNSGVILSLLFRGMSKSLKGLTEADGAALAAAMQEGVATAYGAVMKPAEGTVLTVSRLAAQRAAEAAQENNSVEFVLEEKGRRSGRRRQGLPHHSGRHAALPAGRADPRSGRRAGGQGKGRFRRAGG